MNEHKHQMYL